MLTRGTRAEVNPTARRPRTSARGPCTAGLQRLRLGGVGVRVGLDEAGDDLAAGLAAVLPDALLLARVAGVAAGRPVRHGDVRATREGRPVLVRPRQRDELVAELRAPELLRDRLHRGELVTVLRDRVVVPEQVVAVLE